MGNIDDHISLFSYNIQDASVEGRHVQTGKIAKLFYYQKIAVFLFEHDLKEKTSYAQDLDRYVKSVENHIHGYVLYLLLSPCSNIPQLNQKYHGFNASLGQTGQVC